MPMTIRAVLVFLALVSPLTELGAQLMPGGRPEDVGRL